MRKVANYIHVAVGVIINANDEVLISLRHKNSDQGGLWEFPGGKKGDSESIESALKREFREELNINLETYFPLKKIKHDYGDKCVLLDTWMITDFDGEPKGLEGQLVEWRSLASLKYEDFPAANAEIIKILRPSK